MRYCSVYYIKQFVLLLYFLIKYIIWDIDELYHCVILPFFSQRRYFYLNKSLNVCLHNLKNLIFRKVVLCLYQVQHRILLSLIDLFKRISLVHLYNFHLCQLLVNQIKWLLLSFFLCTQFSAEFPDACSLVFDLAEFLLVLSFVNA